MIGGARSGESFLRHTPVPLMAGECVEPKKVLDHKGGAVLSGALRKLFTAGEEKGEARELFDTLQKAPLTGSVTLLLGVEGAATPETHGDKEAIGGESTLYLCHNFACDKPRIGADAIAQTIRSNSR